MSREKVEEKVFSFHIFTSRQKKKSSIEIVLSSRLSPSKFTRGAFRADLKID